MIPLSCTVCSSFPVNAYNGIMSLEDYSWCKKMCYYLKHPLFKLVEVGCWKRRPFVVMIILWVKLWTKYFIFFHPRS